MSNVIYHSLLTDFDVSLFQSGKHFRIYEKLGSHIIEVDGQWGTQFAVWAPNAKKVSVIGDFNDWRRESHPLNLRLDGSGIWEGFIPKMGKGKLYKYYILSPDGRHLEKGDPFARFWEIPPNTSTITWETNYEWNDAEWLKKRKAQARNSQPMSVYEVHLGSWKKKSIAAGLSYRELAEELVEYVQKIGFTHVEFLPVMEHPYFPSWGYQVTGYFAPSSRFGLPEDFMFLVDKLHQADIGVLLDWVPSHFPYDAHGLADFDGTHLFDHADPRQGFHPDWRSAIFNYGRNEVRSFLISNALYWVDLFHADGLRVDAVASMLYLDYSREEGQWIPNKFGGNENLEAIAFLKEFNDTVHHHYPDVLTIAEESTAFTGVSRPTETGGLGFDQKWMMGWMHDTLKYFHEDTLSRKYHHHAITFSLIYAFSENFMLPLSHDEVVHGKGPLIDKMPGDDPARYANLRTMYAYMFTHPGTQLLFMGDEFGQTSEWKIEAGLDWKLLENKHNKGVQNLITDLNSFYKNSPALYEKQFEADGFQWIDYQDGNRSILTYLRRGKNEEKPLLIACNFTPVHREHYRMGVPFAGTYTEVFNTDKTVYGGENKLNEKPIKSDKMAWDNMEQSIEFDLPGLSVVVFELTKKARKTTPKKTATKKKTISKKVVKK